MGVLITFSKISKNNAFVFLAKTTKLLRNLPKQFFLWLKLTLEVISRVISFVEHLHPHTCKHPFSLNLAVVILTALKSFFYYGFGQGLLLIHVHFAVVILTALRSFFYYGFGQGLLLIHVHFAVVILTAFKSFFYNGFGQCDYYSSMSILQWSF